MLEKGDSLQESGEQAYIGLWLILELGKLCDHQGQVPSTFCRILIMKVFFWTLNIEQCIFKATT